MKHFAVATLLILTACSRSSQTTEVCRAEISELRNEVSDAKVAQHAYKTELAILEERLEAKERNSVQAQDSLQKQLKQVETKIATVDRDQKKIVSDIKKIAKEAEVKNKEIAKSTANLAQLKKELNAHLAEFKGALESVADLTGDVYPVYCVEKGDSLGAIAIKRETTVETIKELNKLDSDRIVVGQKLKMPKE